MNYACSPVRRKRAECQGTTINLRLTEWQNHLGWKTPLRSPSPTVNLTRSSPPLNRVSKHHVYTSFKYLQSIIPPCPPRSMFASLMQSSQTSCSTSGRVISPEVKDSMWFFPQWFSAWSLYLLPSLILFSLLCSSCLILTSPLILLKGPLLSSSLWWHSFLLPFFIFKSQNTVHQVSAPSHRPVVQSSFLAGLWDSSAVLVTSCHQFQINNKTVKSTIKQGLWIENVFQEVFYLLAFLFQAKQTSTFQRYWSCLHSGNEAMPDPKSGSAASSRWVKQQPGSEVPSPNTNHSHPADELFPGQTWPCKQANLRSLAGGSGFNQKVFWFAFWKDLSENHYLKLSCFSFSRNFIANITQ